MASPFRSALSIIALPFLGFPVVAQCELIDLVAPSAEDSDLFGYAVAVTDELALVGAHGRDPGGAAFLHVRDDGGTPLEPLDDTWSLVAELGTTDPGARQLGQCVALDGDVAAVGDPFFQTALVDSGAVLVFQLDRMGTPADPSDDGWIQTALLVPADSAVDHHFGWSVALDGDTLAVTRITGAAYVFERDDRGTPSSAADDLWVEVATLVDSDPGFDTFGQSIAVDGDRVIVGADNAFGAKFGTGAAYVFERDDAGTPSDPFDDTYVERAKLFANNGAGGDHFGFAVDIDGDFALIGAWLDDTGSGVQSGSAYVFGFDDAWTQRSQLFPANLGANDHTGYSVSLVGDHALIGAPGSDATAPGSGAAHLFQRQGPGWFQVDRYLADEESTVNDRYGQAVSLSSTIALVGAPRDDGAEDDAGRAYAVSRTHSCAWVEYGAGVAGTGDLVPVLHGVGDPELSSEIALAVTEGRGGALGLLVGGPAPAASPLAGGTLLVDPAVLQLLPHALGGAAGAAGVGTWLSPPYQVPQAPWLLGVLFYFQAGYVDPGAPFGISLSAGLRLRIG